MDTAAHDRLWRYILGVYGIRVAHAPVCEGHSSPFDMFAQQFVERPSLALWHGPRGGGKSFLSALDTHLTSRFDPGHATRILGGSKAQSEQVYRALRSILGEHLGPLGGDGDQVPQRKLLKQSATYRNGSEVSILAASATSVRGPHVPSLKLDEVDEIDPEIRQQAIGMAMDTKRGGRTQKTSILMTSTWHRSNGPMAELKERAAMGEFPSHTFCIFEVLERCPRERSGRWVGGTQKYEHCPKCPIRQWCHSDCAAPRALPKAKRSAGHYSIDALVQKARVVSPATMRSDYLCGGPQSDGLWFPEFSDEPGGNVTEEAEYLPGLPGLTAHLPVHCPIDSGDQTGGVFFQIESLRDGGMEVQRVRVFAEYYSRGVGARMAATEFMEVARQRCNGRMDRPTTDPAGKAATAVGPVVLGEYAAVGFKPTAWPSYPGSVRQGLNLISSFLCTATGRRDLIIHPRCKRLIEAFKHYERRKVRGIHLDEPADPQHPHEDMMDALRGGLHAAFPEGRRPEPKFTRVHARHIL